MKDINEILNQLTDYMQTNENYSITTQKKYTSIIKLFLLRHGFSFTVNDINLFLTKHSSYIYKYAFKSFLNSIGKSNLYYKIKSVKRKPRKKIFNHIPKVTMQQILNIMPSKFRYMALVQLKTGCRFIEVATIRAENIDFDIHEELVYIKLGMGLSKTKGNKTRSVRLHKKYEPLLRSLCKKPFGYVFLDDSFNKYDKEQIYTKLETFKRNYNRELTSAGLKFGIEHFSSHYLRHLFADEFMMAGGTVESLKLVMGHSKVDTTLDYVSVGDKFADRIIEQMS